MLELVAELGSGMFFWERWSYQVQMSMSDRDTACLNPSVRSAGALLVQY